MPPDVKSSGSKAGMLLKCAGEENGRTILDSLQEDINEEEIQIHDEKLMEGVCCC